MGAKTDPAAKRSERQLVITHLSAAPGIRVVETLDGSGSIGGGPMGSPTRSRRWKSGREECGSL